MMKPEDAFIFGGLTVIIVAAAVAAVVHLSKPERRVEITEAHLEESKN